MVVTEMPMTPSKPKGHEDAEVVDDDENVGDSAGEGQEVPGVIEMSGGVNLT